MRTRILFAAVVAIVAASLAGTSPSGAQGAPAAAAEPAGVGMALERARGSGAVTVTEISPGASTVGGRQVESYTVKANDRRGQFVATVALHAGEPLSVVEFDDIEPGAERRPVLRGLVHDLVGGTQFEVRATAQHLVFEPNATKAASITRSAKQIALPGNHCTVLVVDPFVIGGQFGPLIQGSGLTVCELPAYIFHWATVQRTVFGGSNVVLGSATDSIFAASDDVTAFGQCKPHAANWVHVTGYLAQVTHNMQTLSGGGFSNPTGLRCYENQ